MALIVLDAGVLVAHLDGSDPHHDAAGAALEEHADDDLRLPASAYAEVLVGPARRGRLEPARSEFASLLVEVEPIDRATAEAAAALRAAHRALRLPDALVLACAERLGADAVLTTDRGRRRFPRVRLIG